MNKNTNDNKKIIIDFDGTLAASFDLFIEAMRAAHIKYSFRNVEDNEIETFRHYSALQILKFLGLPMYQVPTVTRYIRRYMAAKVKALPLASNWQETLQTLALDYQLVILSSNSNQNIQTFLDQHELKCFSKIVSDVGLFGKVKAIRKLLKDNRWQNKNVFYIGDEIRDIKAAKKAKISSIAVTWGYNAEQALIIHQPDHVISNSNTLIEILQCAELKNEKQE
ncbi:HAD-IA family hydrolase [Photobacterium leiognathi]|uniref:HAD-IA family hydrolase n=1 Tax=Photobacterium leiognathi TaxID=553611 RepID=UPI0027345C2E|nr:HAD-IA family hydrolase [Photobacterium leiognathi]